jgi:hypothetical protein
VKEGRLSSDEGSRRAYILNTLGKVIESADIERRIEVVEAQLQASGRVLLPGSLTRDDGD